MNTIAKYLSVSLLLMALASPSLGQAFAVPPTAPTFSIDFQGPTIGVPDGTGGIPIGGSDILVPTIAPGPGLLPTPTIAIPSGPGGLGLIPITSGFLEVDALSFGRDVPFGETAFFSVDEFAVGLLGANPPDVFTEGAAGNAEASADVFRAPVTLGWHTAALDGNGLAPTGLPGLGLIEPNPQAPGFPDPGDNLDALDINTSGLDMEGPVYFSLDSAFPDFLESVTGGPPPNTATAQLHGFVGGDVLMTVPGGTPQLYASAIQLGLDVLGTDTDDLDALALWDDGDGQYDPTVDWLAFSVRRGSAIIGVQDSSYGLPIEEGDILMSPLSFGGQAGAPPVIVLRADVELGLATARSGLVQLGDDLNAFDSVPEPVTALVLLAGLLLASLRGFRRA